MAVNGGTKTDRCAARSRWYGGALTHPGAYLVGGMPGPEQEQLFIATSEQREPFRLIRRRENGRITASYRGHAWESAQSQTWQRSGTRSNAFATTSPTGEA